MKPKIYLVVASVLVLTSGCAIVQPVNSVPERNMCEYLSRDLTSTWERRSYWCVPARIESTTQTKTQVQAQVSEE